MLRNSIKKTVLKNIFAKKSYEILKKKNFLKNIENSDFSFTFSLKVSEFSHIFINFYTKFIKNARKLEIFFEKMIKYWFLLCGKCLIGVVSHVESISDSFRARRHVFLNFWGTFVPKNLPPEWRKYWKFGQKVLVWLRKILKMAETLGNWRTREYINLRKFQR